MVNFSSRRAITAATQLSALLASVLVFGGSTAAQFDTQWSNPLIGDWFISGNWSGGVPDALDSTLIANGGVAAISSPGAITGDIDVGGPAGNGGLSITGGGTLTQTTSISSIGAWAGRTGTVTVNGNGSFWDASALVVGGGGSGIGTLNIENGADVTGYDLYLGGGSAATGSLTVTGPGSTLALTNNADVFILVIGNGGTGTMTVSNGGVVTSPFTARIGYSSTSHGSVLVTGVGSRWSSSGIVLVGAPDNVGPGVGSLRIANGGVVQAPAIRVANTASVEVDNGSSTIAGLAIAGGASTPNLNNLGEVSVGVNSDGRMTVSGGGDVWTAAGYIGRNAGRTGAATVQGAGSTWNNSGDMLVGASGTGLLEIRGGATVTNVRAHVGFNANSSGSVLVTDPGSTWTGSGSFFIGNGGSGSLQVLNGATASTAGNSYLGFSTFSQGSATVSGVGSTWNTANTLAIGGSLTDPGGPFGSTLRIESGGVVNAASTILYNSGIIELTEAATLNSPISSRGGLIRTFNAATHAGPISLDSGNLSVTCNTLNATATLSGPLSGPGGLTKSGFPGFTGTLRLTANNTYAGPTTINSGTLLVDGSITSATTVNTGGTLGGSGTVGSIAVMSGGALAPGNSAGLLSSGDASFHGGGNYDFELLTDGSGLAGTEWDSLAVAGTLDVSTLSAANRFNIRLKSLGDANAAGPLTNWNPGVDHTWPSIVSTTGGMTGTVDSTFFHVDTTNFHNAIHGTFQLVQNGNSLDLNYDAADVVDGVLVTNFAEPLRHATPIGNNPNPADPPEGSGAPWYWAAQQFQSDGLPHQLVSIQAKVGDGSTTPPPVVVAELHADNDGTIGDLIGTFAAPDVSGPPSELEFLPDLPMTLDPGTKYWFVLGSATPGDGTFFWQYINTNLAAGTGLIGNFADSTTSGADWNYHDSLFPYYLQVNVLTTIPGDFNGDNAVDAADYVVLRNDPGAVEGQFDEWRANFGQVNGEDAADSSIGTNVAVPEPAAMVLMIFAAPALLPAIRKSRRGMLRS